METAKQLDPNKKKQFIASGILAATLLVFVSTGVVYWSSKDKPENSPADLERPNSSGDAVYLHSGTLVGETVSEIDASWSAPQEADQQPQENAVSPATTVEKVEAVQPARPSKKPVNPSMPIGEKTLEGIKPKLSLNVAKPSRASKSQGSTAVSVTANTTAKPTVTPKSEPKITTQVASPDASIKLEPPKTVTAEKHSSAKTAPTEKPVPAKPASDKLASSADGSTSTVKFPTEHVKTLPTSQVTTSGNAVELSLPILPSPDEYAIPSKHMNDLIRKVVTQRIRKVLFYGGMALAADSLFAPVELELKKLDANPPKTIIEAQKALLKITRDILTISQGDVAVGYSALILFPIYGFRKREFIPTLAKALKSDLPEPTIEILSALMTYFHGFILETIPSAASIISTFMNSASAVKLFDYEKLKADSNLGSGIGLLLHNLTLTNKIKKFEGFSDVLADGVRNVYFKSYLKSVAPKLMFTLSDSDVKAALPKIYLFMYKLLKDFGQVEVPNTAVLNVPKTRKEVVSFMMNFLLTPKLLISRFDVGHELLFLSGVLLLPLMMPESNAQELEEVMFGHLQHSRDWRVRVPDAMKLIRDVLENRNREKRVIDNSQYHQFKAFLSQSMRSDLIGSDLIGSNAYFDDCLENMIKNFMKDTDSKVTIDPSNSLRWDKHSFTAMSFILQTVYQGKNTNGLASMKPLYEKLVTKHGKNSEDEENLLNCFTTALA